METYADLHCWRHRFVVSMKLQMEWFSVLNRGYGNNRPMIRSRGQGRFSEGSSRFALLYCCLRAGGRGESADGDFEVTITLFSVMSIWRFASSRPGLSRAGQSSRVVLEFGGFLATKANAVVLLATGFALILG